MSLILSPEEWEAVRLTLVVAARAVGFGLPLAVLMAWVLARYRFPGRPLLNALVHLPLVLPPVVTGWLLLILFGIRGPIGSLLFDWFGIRLVFTTAGASLACAVMTFPVMVRSVRLSLEAVDPGLEQAARTLGAGRLDRLFNVTLPLASPGILVGGIVGYATCLGEFGAVITFAANIPGQTQTLPLAIYAALQVPGGEAKAAELSLVSLTLALDRAAAVGVDRQATERGAWPMSLSVRLRHRFPSVRMDMAFEVPSPGVTVLFGPSGAGKSTIILAAAGLLRPDECRIEVDGQVHGRHRSRRVAAAGTTARRSGVSGCAAVSAHVGRHQSALRHAPRARRDRCDSTRWSNCWASARCSTAGRTRCPAASASAWRSAARCWRSRICC